MAMRWREQRTAIGDEGSEVTVKGRAYRFVEALALLLEVHEHVVALCLLALVLLLQRLELVHRLCAHARTRSLQNIASHRALFTVHASPVSGEQQ